MLVVTQYDGDVVTIGEDIRILVGRVKGGGVKLSIDAPAHVKIDWVRESDLVGAEESAPPTEITPSFIVTRRGRPGAR